MSLAPDTPEDRARGDLPGRSYEQSRRAFEDCRRRLEEQRDDRQEREDVDRELDRDFFVSELADLRSEIAQLHAWLRPLVQLTSELLQERYLRREED